MTFDEIVDNVVDLTKRPDMAATSIVMAIKAATLKAHQSSFFFKDLVEVAVAFDVARYIQTFDPKQVVPTYRHHKYMRIWEGDVTGYPGDFISYVNAENVLDLYGYQKANVYYLAGSFIQIRTLVPLITILFGCYRQPVVTPEVSYNSWIATEYPMAIVYEAARSIFASTGYREQATEMRALVAEEYRNLIISNVDAENT